jgi:hypothetical protein
MQDKNMLISLLPALLNSLSQNKFFQFRRGWKKEARVIA